MLRILRLTLPPLLSIAVACTTATGVLLVGRRAVERADPEPIDVGSSFGIDLAARVARLRGLEPSVAPIAFLGDSQQRSQMNLIDVHGTCHVILGLASFHPVSVAPLAPDKIVAGTNCGMAPMRRDVAMAKLAALAHGAALARRWHSAQGTTA